MKKETEKLKSTINNYFKIIVFLIGIMGIYLTVYYSINMPYDFDNNFLIYELLTHLGFFMTLLFLVSIYVFISLDRFNGSLFNDLKFTLNHERSEKSELNEEIKNLATQLDFLNGKLQETYEKYLNLINDWDGLIIEFNAMITKIIKSGINISSPSTDLDLDPKSIIFALSNPIRNKLKNFKKIAEVAMKDSIKYSNDIEILKERFNYLKQQNQEKERRFTDKTDKISRSATKTENELKKLQDDYYLVIKTNKKNEEQLTNQIKELLEYKQKLQEIKTLGLEDYIDKEMKNKLANLQLENLNLKQEVSNLEEEQARVESYLLKAKKGKKYHKK